MASLAKLLQVARVLQPNGVYIAVSHGQPSYRLTYLQLESRVRRAWQGMGKETGGVQLTPKFGMIWSTYVKMTMDLCFLEL